MIRKESKSLTTPPPQKKQHNPGYAPDRTIVRLRSGSKLCLSLKNKASWSDIPSRVYSFEYT